PAYPQGAYPPGPGYPYAPPPPPRSNRTLWIVLSIIGGVVLLVCIGCIAIVLVFGRSFVQPAFVATQFCQDLNTQNYSDAYSLFSSRLQSQVSLSAFTTLAQGAAGSGQITACTVSSAGDGNIQFGDTTATLPLTITRSGTSQEGDVTLVKENDAWKIDVISPSLQLTP